MTLQVCTGVLYHTKNRQGTTTNHDSKNYNTQLYHTKNRQGTTTEREKQPYF